MSDTPLLPFKIKIKILQNPFSGHLYTPIPTHPQNFMSLNLIVRTSSFIYIYIYYPRFTHLCPLISNFEKCRNLFLGISMKNVLVQFRRLSYFAAEKITKTGMSRIPRINPLKSTLCVPWN